MSGSRRSASAQAKLGLPDGFQVFSAGVFDGLNQSASRIAMTDAEFYWLENFIRVGDGNLRTLWDAGTALYTAVSGKTIVSFFAFNIGPAQYFAVFLSDGTAVQVAWPSGVVTTISATPSLFYQGTTLPVCVQSGTQFLLIANHNTQNDYWIWDGSILYAPGGIAPFNAGQLIDGGVGYTSVPNYTVFGGSGSGVVLTPVISEGSVVSLTVDNPGTDYLPGEIVQVGFSGGGSDTTPILEAVLSASGISFITLISGGTGFAAGTYALGFTGGGGGSGAAGTYTVVGGQVTETHITAGGSGYTATPGVTFPSGGGSGATAVASITAAFVSGVNVIQGGTNLTGTPVLTIVGGGGTGAQAVANVSAGVITSVTMTNFGQGYSSVPAVEVQTGVNNAAAAILELMPFGVSGTSLETYQSRVWIGYPNQQGKENNGGTFLVSAPDSLTDFATSDGGDIFTNTDRFLRQNYTFLRQTSNFLYATGDSSVSVISNVQTQGSPPSTTFSYQNSDPQIGSSWPNTAQDFSNTILFGNAFGVYGIYGGSVRKVSEKVDELFTNAVLPPAAGALTPTSAVANIYSQKIYLMLMTITDPFTLRPRNVMIGWDGKRWYVSSQTPALIFIGTQEVNSQITAWGTDGRSLYPLFDTPSTALVKVFSTKAYGGDKSYLINTLHSLYLDAVDVSDGQSGLSFSGTVDGIGLAVPVINTVTQALQSCPSGSYPLADSLVFQAAKPMGAVYGAGVGAGIPQVPAISLGVTLASSNADFKLRAITLGVIQTTGIA